MLSIIVPCFNEEKRLINTFNEIVKAIKISKIKKYEIIFIDDKSTDKSLFLAYKLSKKLKGLKIFKNKKNYGLGYVFFKGINISKGSHIIYVPSDNSHKGLELAKLFRYYFKDFDFVSTYYERKERRFLRGLFTATYTPLLNFLYGLNLPYYNGLTLYKKKIIKNLGIKNNSFSYNIEIFVKLFHTKSLKYTFKKTKVNDKLNKTHAFGIRNSLQVIYKIFIIFLKSIKYRILKYSNP